jgi:hypothetical protein
MPVSSSSASSKGPLASSADVVAKGGRDADEVEQGRVPVDARIRGYDVGQCVAEDFVDAGSHGFMCAERRSGLPASWGLPIFSCQPRQGASHSFAVVRQGVASAISSHREERTAPPVGWRGARQAGGTQLEGNENEQFQRTGDP